MIAKIESSLLDSSDSRHLVAAAVKLQKVYKSFRTRRKLADCAVLVEQSWWKLLDFAELKHSSVSFFDIEKHETAISRWSRARTRAAKVGKGLSKDAKAQKLALQHWLEAIDPRHRYGHNLHFYYDKWLKCQSREPFFYWLDIGEGKDINLGKCPRSKLQEQCVKYLGPMERLAYEVVVEDGRLFYKQTGEVLHTTGESARAKWIFVLSTSKALYVGKKKKGSFQHSSFLAGGAASCAGRLVVENGVLKAVWPYSGHYRPTKENFEEFISFLQEKNVELSNVKMTPVDEDDDYDHQRSHLSEEDLNGNMSGLEDEEIIAEKANLMETESLSAQVAPKTSKFKIFGRELTNLEISKIDQETTQAFEAELDKTILNQIKPCQLGKQLSCKWTSGVGPRIGCVRGYPCEVQFRALEQVNLSPKRNNHFLRSVIPIIPMSWVNWMHNLFILFCK